MGDSNFQFNSNPQGELSGDVMGKSDFLFIIKYSGWNLKMCSKIISQVQETPVEYK